MRLNPSFLLIGVLQKLQKLHTCMHCTGTLILDEVQLELDREPTVSDITTESPPRVTLLLNPLFDGGF